MRVNLPLLKALFALVAILPLAQLSAQSDAAAHLANGYAALQAHRSDRAAQEFNAVLATDPANVEANANLGVIAFLSGNCAQAEPYLRTSLEADPNLAKAQGILGLCDKRAADPAAEQLLHAAFLHLTEPALRLQVGVELADLYYQRGDLDKVLPVVHALVALSPENTDILFFAQRVYQQIADETLNKLAVLAPDSARMQQLIAERLVNAGDLSNAIAHYRAALKLDPRLPGMHFELAEALIEATPMDPKAQAEAESELEEAIRVSGDSAGIESRLGEIALARSDTRGAKDRYMRALALNPSSETALMGIAKIEMQQSQPEKAVAHLQKAVALDPMDAQAHYRLALAYRSLHQTAELEEQMKLFADIKQTDDRVAALYREMGKQSANPPENEPPSQTNAHR